MRNGSWCCCNPPLYSCVPFFHVYIATSFLDCILDGHCPLLCSASIASTAGSISLSKFLFFHLTFICVSLVIVLYYRGSLSFWSWVRIPDRVFFFFFYRELSVFFSLPFFYDMIMRGSLYIYFSNRHFVCFVFLLSATRSLFYTSGMYYICISFSLLALI